MSLSRACAVHEEFTRERALLDQETQELMRLEAALAAMPPPRAAHDRRCGCVQAISIPCASMGHYLVRVELEQLFGLGVVYVCV